jgi:hypothetical protein
LAAHHPNFSPPPPEKWTATSENQATYERSIALIREVISMSHWKKF